MLDIFTEDKTNATPIHLVSAKSLPAWLEKQDASLQKWVNEHNFKGSEGELLRLPSAETGIAGILFGLADDDSTTSFPLAQLSSTLKGGSYTLELESGELNEGHAALSWAMGTYRYDAYKTKDQDSDWPKLVTIKENADSALRFMKAIFLTRDLVNTPANDMGPAELEAASRSLADEFGASLKVIEGEDLLTENFPLVHAVGRASTRSPRLIDLTWGEESAPKISLVGKGVCFDSGGLNLKPGSSMSLMKKDMGGAANVLGLAHMIMAAGLKVRLRVLIPAVENSISGNAFRPGDVLPSRHGLTVEIGNTDAEGRLVLADALTLADDEEPAILIDMATLTGAARSALGPEVPPFYCDDEEFAADVANASRETKDPLWRMPLWPGYEGSLKGQVGDINHISDMSMAGSITAALFLKRFVSKAKLWAHLDIYAWNPKARPGQPAGGEAQTICALFKVLADRYT